MSPTVHVPVMPDEVLQFLLPGPRQVIVDATVGCGGHGLLIWDAMGRQGTLAALDRDPAMIEAARRRFDEQGVASGSVHWIVGSFGDLAEHLASVGIRRYDGVLFDLGLSSAQLEDPGRGFSFQTEGYLDARFNRTEAIPTLAQRLARMSVQELERVLREYADERWARRIARRIAWCRDKQPIHTTAQLAWVIRSAVPPARRHRRIDTATRTFQALRMLVNDELNHLAQGLEQAIEGLNTGGRIVVISFHSGEDRVVKETFRRHDVRRRGQEEKAEPVLEVVTPKPVRPTEREIESNPRARSARLRAARKIEARD